MEQFRSPLVVVYYKLEFTGSKAKETSYWRNRVIMVARKFSAPGTRKVNFAISDAAEFSRELTDLGLIYTNVTPVVAARDLSERRFVMHEPLSMENLEQFAEGVVNGSLIPYIKSAPRPENNNEPVKIVVGNTFEEIVNDATKDVLIYFHSPWCGECLEIDKKLVKLAKKLKDDKNIVIASMDATTNDAPKQYIIKGFPSIFIATKASKMTPKVFEGKYEVDELLAFIAQQATEPLHRHKEKTDSVIKSRSQRIEL
jgi:protein disulfide isomerase